MPFKRPKLKYFNTISLTLMLILGPFGLYYLFYFSEQKTYFTNRNFRLLSVLNKQIQAKVDGVAGAYQKAAESATQAYLPTKPGDFQMDGFLRPIVKDGNDIVLDSLLLKSPAEGQKVVTYDIKQESGSQFLVLDYTGSDGTSAVNIRVKGKLEDLLAPFARKLIDKNNFDGVLIAEEDGKVFFEQGASELGVTNLQGLVNEDQQKIDFERLRQNSNVFDAHIAQTNYKVFIQPVRLSYAKMGAEAGKNSGWVVCGLVSSGHFLSESAAISYTVLITMTFLAIVVALSAPFLKLLFMRPRERVQVADVYFLAFSALVGTALIATFLVYSLSYWNLERQLDDQLRTLSTQIRSNFENELRDANRQLERLNTSGRVQETIRILSKLDDLNRPGDTLDSNSSISTTDLRGQLNRSLDKLDQIDRNQTTNREHPSDQGWKNNYGCPQGKRCSGQTGILGQLVGYRDHYPYLSSAFWADRDGQQRIKWTTKADLTPFISVNSRPYFRHVADGRPWEFEYSSGEKDGRKLFKYFLEPVYSMTTGGQQVILSAPVPSLENESNGRSWVSAMDIRPLSLMQVVLPSDLGYGYCVIDHDGKVLFHSDPSRNLLENFFAETDNNDYLRSVVLANESKPMTLRYQGLGHRLFVTPLPNTPWSLITFRDKHILRVAALELITYAIFLFVLYALLLLLLFGIYHLWKSLDRPAIAWPYSKRAKNYNFSIIVNLALALAFLVAIFSVRGWAIIAFAVVLPVIGFLFHHWNLKKGPSFGRVGAKVSHFIEHYTPLDYRSGYIFTMVTLLILVSVLPMLTFFKFAYDREMSLYVKLGQISLARGLHERADRLHSHYQLNGHSSGATDEQKSQSIEDNRRRLSTFLGQRLSFENAGQSADSKFSDVYGAFFFNTRFSSDNLTSGSHTAQKDDLEEQLTTIVPFSNAIAAKVPGLRSGTLHTESDAAGKLVLHTAVGSDANLENRVLHIESDGPRLGRQTHFSWWAGLIAILIIIAAGLYVLIGFIGRKLFLLDSQEPLTLYGSDLSLISSSKNLLVLGSSFTRGTDLLGTTDLEVIDLRSGTKETWVEQNSGALTKANGRQIAIDYFEAEWDDPTANREKIRLLERFLRYDKKVVVFSSVNLFEFCYEHYKDSQNEATNEVVAFENQRGTRIFTSFSKVYLEDKADHESFHQIVLTQQEQWLKDSVRTPKEIARIKKLFRTVEKECGRRLFLQSIGADLLKHPQFEKFTKEQIVSYVHDEAHAYYHAIWDTCSKDEKLTLYSLAKYRFINSSNGDLPRLLRRGLIIREPFLRLMNKSFKHFVIEETSPEKLASWKRDERGSVWDTLRVPFFVILVSAAAFLFVSQRELYNSALALVSALAVAMPTIFKVLGMFSNPSKT